MSDLHRYGMKLKLIYSICGLILGLACILVGAWLAFVGATGNARWVTSFWGFSSELSNATPGIFLFVVGVCMVITTRFRVRETTVHPTPAVPPTPAPATSEEIAVPPQVPSLPAETTVKKPPSQSGTSGGTTTIEYTGGF